MPTPTCKAKNPSTCRVHGEAYVVAAKERMDASWAKLKELDHTYKRKNLNSLDDYRASWSAYQKAMTEVDESEMAYYTTAVGFEELRNKAFGAHPALGKRYGELVEKALFRMNAEEQTNARNPMNRPTFDKATFVKPDFNIMELDIPDADLIDQVYEVKESVSGLPAGYVWRKRVSRSVNAWGYTRDIQEAKSGIGFYRDGRNNVATRLLNERALIDNSLARRWFSEHQENDLRASGVPEHEIDTQRARYVKEATANGAALKEIRETYQV